MDRWLRATINTWRLPRRRGSEAAFREELVALAAVPLAFVVAGEAEAGLIGVVVFLLIVELLNTAIEKPPTASTSRSTQIGRVRIWARRRSVLRCSCCHRLAWRSPSVSARFSASASRRLRAPTPPPT
jgi:hypothetical protein